MRYLLTIRGRKELHELSARHPLLGFDLDGTLAPIVPDPGDVELPTGILLLLRHLARRFPLVVLSGRARSDVFKRLAGVPVREVYGNHGIEPTHASELLRDRISGWAETLRSRLSQWEGVWVEDKKYSLTVHYRHARWPVRARDAATLAASVFEDARLLQGKSCLNILPLGIAHKGRALTEAQHRFGCESAIYFGDDETDEDVFSNCDPKAVLGIRIGRRPTSRAAYYLRRQSEMELALELLRKA